MVRKKIDNRLRVLIENGMKLGHRTMFVIVGDKGRDQVVILHHMLSKAAVKARPDVLWCYKKDLGFASHRKKRMKMLQRKLKAGKLDVDEDDPFELFISSTNIRYCYYSETHKILGQTFGMCILQDFEALTPNLLARSLETVSGGGLIVLLLRSVSSLRQLYAMSMDVHERYRTESHTDVVGRFNERFLLSLGECGRCLVVDDNLDVLPLSSHNLQVEPILQVETPPNSEALTELVDTLRDTQPLGVLAQQCATLDQAKALLRFVEAVSDKSLSVTVSLTAARGRGKSAALGLAVAAAVAFGYANIFVTSPSPENLKTFFEFLFKGFDSLEYTEHMDYDIVQSTNPEFGKAVVRVNIFREHRQTVQYISPNDAHRLGQAELLVVDEAAAIPLPLLQALLGPYLVFLASTISGYEGTGRSLSLKLLQQLRTSTAGVGKAQRRLAEVTLTEPIRYREGDAVESWLISLLCLDATLVPALPSGCPPPDQCQLYYVNRDTLFCYHKASEAFLHRLVSLYVASHYKNSPNDLQMLSDAPAHHLFCLLGPVAPNKTSLPEVLVVIQVCMEGGVSKDSAAQGLQRGKRAAGDLVPWMVAQQFQDTDFPSLSGARVVRIAAHPDYMGMGYGGRALSLLTDYYEGRIAGLDLNPDPSAADDTKSKIEPVSESALTLLTEAIKPRKSLPPLLLELSERPPESLRYLAVSYGLSEPLLKFWKRGGYVPVYLRQTTSALTGEHSCIMIRPLRTFEGEAPCDWLRGFFEDFRRRFLALLASSFAGFTPALALGLLHNKACQLPSTTLTREQLFWQMTAYDLRRLEMYAANLADYRLVMDLLPGLASLHFHNRLGDLHLSAVQAAILLGLGLQHKSVDKLATELELAPAQLLGLYNRVVRRCATCLRGTLEAHAALSLPAPGSEVKEGEMAPAADLVKEMDAVEQELKGRQRAELKKLQNESLKQFEVQGSELEWGRVLGGSTPGIISVKSGVKRIAEPKELLPMDAAAKKPKGHREEGMGKQRKPKHSKPAGKGMHKKKGR